ncbi:MAG: hypothetical protein AAFR77_11495 [Cyanobacteria bacterium J06631_2]
MPSGQLAEATITGFDPLGVPNAGTIAINHDANGVGWFIDSTPLDNSEFTVQNTGGFLPATAESKADRLIVSFLVQDEQLSKNKVCQAFCTFCYKTC